MIMNEMGNFQVQDMGEDLPICPCEKCLGCRPHPPKGFLWTAYDLIHPEFDDLELPEEYKDRDHRSLLCSGLLVGFVLKSRTWGMPLRHVIMACKLTD